MGVTNISIRIQGAPSFYQCQVDVLQELPFLLKERDIGSLLIIHGEKSFHAIQPYWPELEEVKTTYVAYSGVCTDDEIKRFKELAYSLHVDAVVGVGGGKVLDLAKATSHEAEKDVILIPTLASTCAAWTPLSVIYDDEGRFQTYTVFPRSSYMVLVEPRVILEAPLEYLKAGIGDTLAKWYEANALVHDLEYIPLPVEVALHAAKLSRDRLLAESHQALIDCEEGTLSSSVLTIIEANILLGGMVGGFGDEYGRVAGAHSIHNALTFLPGTKGLHHGEKVAYGILVQLALEGNEEEIKSLLPFYRQIGLPSSCWHLFIQAQEDILTIAEKALLPQESIHFMKDKFKEHDIVAAIEKLEVLQKEGERN
ncbi:iron-containing alcohol dehydrogenase family protein [Sutcliffiella rhizosphaerae]|uniref:Hydroxycarboxylate dehydrogenase A n=1 Tax=Sutcliffiella rhizosphaerae TaxID=2880967 RepID=A0ABM8YTU5_9BACI|nr:iron-containing alcohol dehydrogenase family protein [Sutcliffiella rhizosphaerae]CAG9623388.1 Hydroxycarboxylate dehydrogenase A [Sutcliffiella rhizosphaerae]